MSISIALLKQKIKSNRSDPECSGKHASVPTIEKERKKKQKKNRTVDPSWMNWNACVYASMGEHFIDTNTIAMDFIGEFSIVNHFLHLRVCVCMCGSTKTKWCTTWLGIMSCQHKFISMLCFFICFYFLDLAVSRLLHMERACVLYIILCAEQWNKCCARAICAFVYELFVFCICIKKNKITHRYCH